MTSVLTQRPEARSPYSPVLVGPRPAVAPIRVAIQGVNAISRAGVASRLERRPEVRVVEDADPSAGVVLVIAAGVDDVLVQRLRALHRQRGRQVVLIVDRVGSAALPELADAGVTAVVPRVEATVDRIVAALREAAADCPAPAEPAPRPLALATAAPVQPVAGGVPISARERDVLRLVADGYSTRDVAAKLCYSERTIKNVLQDVTVRLDLRNRTHAVAVAIRNGWI
jgi:DNA-binding NarL/FixJ family response regulator